MTKKESPTFNRKQVAEILCQSVGFSEDHAKLDFGTLPVIDKKLLELRQPSFFLAGGLGVGKTAYLAIMLKDRFMGHCLKYPNQHPEELAIRQPNTKLSSHEQRPHHQVVESLTLNLIYSPRL